jgi:acyl carrier protein
MKRAAQLMVLYASRRDVATGKLLDNPVTRVKLSSLTAAADALDSLITQTAQAIDHQVAVPVEIYTACKIAGPELAWSAVDDLAQLLGGRGYIETNLVPQMIRDVRILRIFEGPTETLRLFLGARILNQPDDLAAFMTNSLSAGECFNRIQEAVGQINERVMGSRQFDNDTTRKQWAYNLCGELTTYGVLMAAAQNAFARTQQARYQRAQIWAEAQFERVLASAMTQTAGERLLLQPEALDQLVLDYQEAIGSVEQTMAGEDHELDALLRTTAPVRKVDQPKAPPILITEPAPVPELAAETVAERPQEASHPEATAIRQWIIDWMAKTMKLLRSSIDVDKPFAEYGMDSIKGVEFATQLEDWLGGRIEIDDIATWNFPTITTLVEYIVGELNGATNNVTPLANVPASGSHPANGKVPDFDQLSDEDIAELLTQEIEASKKSSRYDN